MSNLHRFQAFGKPGAYVLSLGLRATQVFFAVLVLGLSAGSVNFYGITFDGPAVGLTVSILTLIYVVPSFFVYYLYPAILATVAEIILMVLYLVAFALLCTNFASGSCTYYFGIFDDEKRTSSRCGAGKADIAFTFLNWLLFIATFVLHVVYTLVPYSRIDGALTRGRSLYFGAIFPLDADTGLGATAPVGPTDLEANESIEKAQETTTTIPVSTNDVPPAHYDTHAESEVKTEPIGPVEPIHHS